MIDKAALRQVMRQVTADVTDVTMRSVELWTHVAQLDSYRSARTVMSFVSLPAEPDTAGFHARLARDGKRLVLPRIDNGVLLAVVDTGDYRRGAFGIPEPIGDPVDGPLGWGEIDLVVVPGLAFTVDGARLGRGKAYYDVFLASMRAHGSTAEFVGVCFAEQLLDDLPIEAHDVRVDRVLAC